MGCYLYLLVPSTQERSPEQSQEQNSVPSGGVQSKNSSKIMGSGPKWSKGGFHCRVLLKPGCRASSPNSLRHSLLTPGTVAARRPIAELPQNAADQGRAVQSPSEAAESPAGWALTGLPRHWCHLFARGWDERLEQRGRQALDELVLLGQLAQVKINNSSSVPPALGERPRADVRQCPHSNLTSVSSQRHVQGTQLRAGHLLNLLTLV